MCTAVKLLSFAMQLASSNSQSHSMQFVLTTTPGWREAKRLQVHVNARKALGN